MAGMYIPIGSPLRVGFRKGPGVTPTVKSL
jgi:hypothetical protein